MSKSVNQSAAMEVTHKLSMNLRFVERDVADRQLEDGTWVYKKVRVLQQMYVPNDWSKHDEFWRDVPFTGPENPNAQQP